MVNLFAGLHGVVNLMANAVFTIFALYLTLVCTFGSKFALSKFGVNQIFRAVSPFQEALVHSSRVSTYVSRRQDPNLSQL